MIEDDYIRERQKPLDQKQEFPLFRNLILYSEIAAELTKIQQTYSDIMQIQEIGKSALGKPLYCVFLSDESGIKELESTRIRIADSLKNPEKYLKQIKEKEEQFKAVVFINCSTHGIEYCGVDAGFKVIRYLTANREKESVKKLLKSLILIINICANPDGRWLDTLNNGNNMDLNRDSMTASQPEIKCLNDKIRFVYFPNSTVDIHGYYAEAGGLFDCCTEPHNPNSEYKLQDKLIDQSGLNTKDFIKKQTNLSVIIPSIDYKNQGWDDYTPVFNSTINAMTGGLGHTLEVNYGNAEGIEIGFITILSNLNFVAENKEKYLELQLKTFLNGVNEEKSAEIIFPKYYVIPIESKLQKNVFDAMNIVNKLIDFKVEVGISSENFTHKGVDYKAEKVYVVNMKQALRGLANNILWEGEDITKKVVTLYDISVFSLKLFYNINVVAVYEEDHLIIPTRLLKEKLSKKEEIKKVSKYLKENEERSNVSSKKSHYAFLYKNNESIKYIMKLNKYLSKTDKCNKNYEIKQIEGNCYFTFKKNHNSDHFVEKHFPYTDYLEVDSVFIEKYKSICSISQLNMLFSFRERTRYVYIGDNGGCYMYLKSLGYDVTQVTMEMLNLGYQLRNEEYQGLIINGIQAFYTDQFYDNLGISWCQSYALHDRSKEMILSFARNTKYILGCGFTGATFASQLTNNSLEIDFFRDSEKKNSMENGVFNVNLIENDILTASYEKIEKFFLYLPCWLKVKSDDWIISARFSSFYKGFCKDDSFIRDQPAIIRNKPNNTTNIVLIGFDPAFRLYSSSSFRLLYNAMTYFDSLSY
jgi:hypothetical protein